jgi:hypothetical protein
MKILWHKLQLILDRCPGESQIYHSSLQLLIAVVSDFAASALPY